MLGCFWVSHPQGSSGVVRFLIGNALAEARRWRLATHSAVSYKIGVGGGSYCRSLLFSSMLAVSWLPVCRRLISIANWIVARTTSMSGFHRSIGLSMLLPPSFQFEYPPSAYERSLNRSPCCSRSFLLCSSHFLQQKRKCWIDSISPHPHSAVSATLILQRYTLSLVLHVRSCVRIAASALFSYWYSTAALPRWSAASIFLVNMPTSGRPARSGPVVMSAFFSACFIRYHGRPSRLSSCAGGDGL